MSTVEQLRAALAEHGITDVPEHAHAPGGVRYFPVVCRSQRTRREIAEALPDERRDALIYKAEAYGLDLDEHDVIEVQIPSWHTLQPGSRTRGYDHYLTTVARSRVPAGYDVIGRAGA